MAEQLSTTTTQMAAVGTNQWHVNGLVLRRGWYYNVANDALAVDTSQSRIHISLIGDKGLQREYDYTGAVADGLIVALNKANLTVTSLEKRIFNQLIADGKEAGVIVGAPD